VLGGNEAEIAQRLKRKLTDVKKAQVSSADLATRRGKGTGQPTPTSDWGPVLFMRMCSQCHGHRLSIRGLESNQR
jgi:hypothetical protein